MKKVLAVNPWIYDFAAYNFWLKPLGLLYMIEYLKEQKFEIDYLDCLDAYKPDKYGGGKLFSEEIEKPIIYKGMPRKYKRYGISEASFIKKISGKKYDYILMTSGMTYWYKGVFRAIELAKKHWPDTPVILGGIYATLCANHAKKYSAADEILTNSQLNRLSDILGLKQTITHQKIYDRVLNYDMYSALDSAALRTIIGCPYRCGYCASHILQPEIFSRNTEFVIAEIEHLACRGVKHIAFYDDALLFNKDIKKILSWTAGSGRNLNFYTPNGLHARFMDAEIAMLMKKSNFVEPRFGLEFLGAEASNYHDKVNLKEILQAVRYLKESGYKNGEYSVYIIIGLPGQNMLELRSRIDELHDMGIRVRLSEFSPIPGTAVFNQFYKNEVDPLEHNNSFFPLINTEAQKDVQALKIHVKNKNAKYNG